MRFKIRLVIALPLLFAAYTGAYGQVSGTPSPQIIIGRMAERYAAASSYQDSGVVETVVEGALPRRSTDVSFKTVFKRPQKFRFEWAQVSRLSLPGRSVVWSDGEKTFAYYTHAPDKVERPEDLGSAIAGATGVSLGSAHTVPRLLVRGIGGFSVTGLSRVTLKGQELFEGEECFVLEGYHPSGEAWRLWLGKTDYLLRKVRTGPRDGEFEEEIHRDILINAPVAEEVFSPKLAPGLFPAAPMSREKEADIRRLLELVLPRDRINQSLNEIIGALKTAMPQVPEKIWQEVVSELRLDSETVFLIYLPIYDAYYSGDEVKQLIAFYESALGKKTLRNMPLIEAEAALQGEAVGHELLKKITERLRAKGYNTPAA
jgi:uncharacterized protein